MVLELSDLEPGCCQIRDRDLPAPSGNNGQDKMGYTKRKKHQHPRTEETSDEHERNKKAKKNNPEKEVDSSSSDHSCFVALVTASNLHKDALDLPKEFTSSNLLKRGCREIFIRDRWERSWALDLAFNKSSDTFFIRQGWRSFCDENGKKAGSLFVFKLVGNRETPLLSICSIQVNKNNKESCMDHSTRPTKSRCVTLTVEHTSFRRGIQRLPLRFMREHGLDKTQLITLLGKDGTKWVGNLRRESTRGRMRFGKGWREFGKANGLKVGDLFTLELVWKDNTPMFSLIRTESTSDRMQQQGEHCSKASNKESVSTKPNNGNKKRKAKNNKDDENSKELVGNKCLPTRKDSLSPDQNRFLTLTVTRDSLIKSRLYLPPWFARKCCLDKLRMITLLGKDGTKWLANIRPEHKSGGMRIEKGWRHFAITNGLRSGESFTLESVWENETPMLSLFSTESTNDIRKQGEYYSEGREKEYFSTQPSSGNKTRAAKNNVEEMRDSSSAIQNQLVTLTLTPEDVRGGKLILPSQFMKDNGINKLGKITMLGKSGTRWLAFLLSKDGLLALGCGWEEFCEANGVKTGESFTLECIYEQDTTHVFKFCSNYGE